MFRIRMALPKGNSLAYRYTDILHDALVNAWTCAGAASEDVTGYQAKPWNFAALGWRRDQENRVHTLIVSTPDHELSEYMKTLKSSDVAYARTATGESVNFSDAEIVADPYPIGPGQNAIGVLMLSPLAISRKDKKSPRWHVNLKEADLSAAVNSRLSKIAGRAVKLEVHPDALYLRANPRHDVLIQVKESRNGSRAFVIGMKAPLVLQGNENDLRLAWYAGIGEKTRNGFGCIGLAEKGVGR